jgi:uncharacterized protein (TIGR02996 family)
VRTQDELAFLASIRDDPDNDTARLAYADWLDGLDTASVPCLKCGGLGEAVVIAGLLRFEDIPDESGLVPRLRKECPQCNGHHTTLDTSNHDRAELIRVQCALERHEPCPKCDEMHKRHVGAGKGICHGKVTLILTQKALLEANAERWRAGPACGNAKCMGGRPFDSCQTCWGSADAGGLMRRFNVVDEYGAVRGDDLVTVTYHRGMKRVHCRAADVWTWDRVGTAEDMSDRHDEFFPTDWAKAVCAAHPDVVEFEITDKCPLVLPGSASRGRGRWFLASPDANTVNSVPEPLFDGLCGELEPGRPKTKVYPTLEEAQSDLRRFAVRWTHTHLKKETQK